MAKSKEATTHGGARREARAVRAAERGWFGNGRLGTPPRAPARQAQFERWDLPFVSRPFSAPLAIAVRRMSRKGPFSEVARTEPPARARHPGYPFPPALRLNHRCPPTPPPSATSRPATA